MQPVTLRASTITSREVTWLWHNRVPRGKITMLSGDPGIGKSFATCAIVRAVTRGEALPDSDVPISPGNVIICNAEDDPEDTLNPRLEQLGADLERVHYWTGTIDDAHHMRTVRFPTDATTLDQLFAQLEPSLLIIDPFAAYIELAVNTWQDAAVRGVLAPIATAAMKYRVAVVCVRHLVKSDRDQDIYRGQGSIGFTGAARSELFFQWPDAHSPRRIIRTIKHNNSDEDEIQPVAFELSRDIGFRWIDIPRIDDEVVVWALIEELLGASAMPINELRAQLISQGVTEAALDKTITGHGVKRIHQGGRWLYTK